jgi:hypothetical protein
MTPDQALSAYVSMDGPRSLPKLREQLTDRGLKVPSLGWFKKWSSRDEWVSRAQEHDRQVSARASEISVEAEAQERVSSATKFDQAASAALDLVIAGIAVTAWFAVLCQATVDWYRSDVVICLPDCMFPVVPWFHLWGDRLGYGPNLCV